MENNNHNRITQLHGRLIKEEGKPAMVKNAKEFTNQMNCLIDGEYDITITPVSNLLDKLKKRYFVMESELAGYLGFHKTELHEILKLHIGRKIDHNGKEVYESIAEIKEPDEMKTRLEMLHELAAIHFGYVFIDRDNEIIFSWKQSTI